MSTAVRRLVVWCALFALYAVTTGRSVGWEDSAFFQMCHAQLGVPYGPGFPLYVLTGRLFILPFGTASAWGSNLFSGIAFALAGVLVLEIALRLSRLHAHLDHPAPPSAWAIGAGIGVALGWGTLDVNWQQAVRTEVYGLVLVCVLLTAWLAIVSRTLRGSESRRAIQWAAASCWCWGLGMAIHPLIMAAAGTPWVLYAIWPWIRRFRAVSLLAVTAVLPGTLYLYPVLRGSLDGVWAWGDFSTFEFMLDYFLRLSAWAAVQSPDGGLWENLRGWWHGLPTLLPAGLWLPFIVALWWQRRNPALLGSLAGVVALVLWAAPYDPTNLDLMAYFLPFIALASVAVSIFVIRAVTFLQSQMPALGRQSRLAIGFFSICLLLSWPVTAILASREVPQTHAGADRLVDALLESLPQNALVWVAEDNLLGTLEYKRRVTGKRPDVHVVALGALRYPFYRRSVADLLPAAGDIQWDDPHFWGEERWERSMRSLFAARPAGVAWFCQFDNVPGITAELLTPAGYLYQVSFPHAAIHWEDALSFWTTAPGLMRLDPTARAVLARWTFNFGAYAMRRNQTDIGWQALLSAVHLAPDDPETYYMLGMALKKAGRIEDAGAMFAAAEELAPYRDRYRDAVLGGASTIAGLP
jgi:tetratricopeptide (TPR) repeat protein